MGSISINVVISEATADDNFLVTNCQCLSRKTKVKIPCNITIGIIIINNDLEYKPSGINFFIFFEVFEMNIYLSGLNI